MVQASGKDIFKTPAIAMTILLLMLGALCFSGCSDSESKEKAVRVCNNDNHEYTVKLNREDGTVVEQFNLGEAWDLADRCDSFKDVSAGRYYVSIYEDKDTVMTDATTTFTFDENDSKYFKIDSTGDISGSDKSVITVCNNDNEEYRVKLFRKDGTLIGEFTLGEAWDLADRCDDFENVTAGQYYITIHKDNAAAADSQSNDFTYDLNEYEYFLIDDTGKIQKG